MNSSKPCTAVNHISHHFVACRMQCMPLPAASPQGRNRGPCTVRRTLAACDASARCNPLSDADPAPCKDAHPPSALGACAHTGTAVHMAGGMRR